MDIYFSSTNFNSLFFHFSDLQNLFNCMDSMFPCYSLLIMEVIWLNMVSVPPSITIGWFNFKTCQNFVATEFFLYLSQDKFLWVEFKIYGGVIFITMLMRIHYFISLETANTQKSEVLLLRISSGNVNASVAICQYPQTYNFEISLCKYIYLEF